MISIPTMEAQNSFPTLLAKSRTQIVSVTNSGRDIAFVMSPTVLENYVKSRIAVETQAMPVLDEPQEKESGYDEWLIAKVSKTKSLVESGQVEMSSVADVRARLKKKMQEEKLAL